MRTGIAGLPTPHPIRERLPGIYLDDDFTTRFTEALDEVLAPVFATLDCFSDYLDPHLASEDFLAWLAGWVAFPLDESWAAGQRRELVAHAVELHRWRGTRRGLEAHVRLLTDGGDVEVLDSGGCTWSERAGAPLPGSGGPARVTVRVGVADPSSVDRDRLRAAIVELVPAHVTVDVDVTARG
jgi:phage tail-like protein